MVNYYEEFELDPGMSCQAIREALFEAKKKWGKRQNAADLDKRQEAERKVTLIDEAVAALSDEAKKRAYDEELSRYTQEQRQTQQQYMDNYGQQQTQPQDYYSQSQPDTNSSAYGNAYSDTSVSFKENAKLTGIVSYLYWIGWLIAFFGGDREGAKVHLNSSAVLYLLFIICNLAEKLGSTIAIVFNWVEFGLVILWVIGFVYALKGENKELPLIGGIHIIK